MSDHPHVGPGSEPDARLDRGSGPAAPTASGPKIQEGSGTFVVKLRNSETRSWGDQIEVVAANAQDAAEQIAGGERLVEGPGDRANLRARVWKTPYGSVPERLFYANVPGRVP